MNYFYADVILDTSCTLKNVVKTCEVEKAVRMKARKVLKPPLRTAGPMSLSVLTALSSPEPRMGGQSDDVSCELS